MSYSRQQNDQRSEPMGALWEKSSQKCPLFMAGNIELDLETLRKLIAIASTSERSTAKLQLVAFQNRDKDPSDNRPHWYILPAQDRMASQSRQETSRNDFQTEKAPTPSRETKTPNRPLQEPLRTRAPEPQENDHDDDIF